jgi:hypothetical protein
MKPLSMEKDQAALEEQHQLNLVGEELVRQFYIMLRTCRIYDPTNENYVRQVERFGHILTDVLESYEHATLHVADGYLYFNDERLRTDLDKYLIVKYLQETFSMYQCAGLRFDRGVEESEWSALFGIFARLNPSEGENNLSLLREEMKRAP